MPLGHTTGGPNDAETQRAIVRTGLQAGASMIAPGSIIDLPWRWRDEAWKADPLSWSRKRQDAGRSGKSAGDTRTARSDEPRYQTDGDRAAAEAVSFDDQCQVCLGLPPAD